METERLESTKPEGKMKRGKRRTFPETEKENEEEGRYVIHVRRERNRERKRDREREREIVRRTRG